FVEPEEITGEPNPFGGIQDFRVDKSGNVDVLYSRLGLPPTPMATFGPPAIVPTVNVDPPNSVTGTKANLTGTVGPEGMEVEDCRFEYGVATESGTQFEPPVPCEGSIPTDTGEHAVHASIENLQTNGTEYAVRLVAKNKNGTERSETVFFKTAFEVATERA